jgi:hypothetical protein
MRLSLHQQDDSSALAAFDPRPVIAIDIDGVLNALCDGPRFTVHELTIPALTVKSPFFAGRGERDVTIRARVDAAVIAWVNDLATRFDVVWATSWENAANTVFAPAVGLGQYQVAVSSAENPPRFGHVVNGDLAAWKSTVLAGRYHRRPLVWIDDMAAPHRHHIWRHPDDDEHTLVVVPDPDIGLGPADIAEVETFLARYMPDN